MKLSKKQRKTLKKEVRDTPIDQLAKELGISQKELIAYLKKNWREEKFEKIVKTKTDLRTNITLRKKIKTFSFNNWVKENWLFLIILAIIPFIVYFNSLNNYFLSDDIATIVESPNIKQANYFTLSHFPFFSLPAFFKFINFNLFGLNPIPYHLLSLFAHIGSTLTLFLLVGFFFPFPVNLITGLFFAVHPLLSEAVIWISGQSYATTALLVFLSFTAYLLYREKGERKYFLIALFTHFVAFFGSEKMVTYPGILILYEFLEGDLFKAKTWKRLWPFVFLGFAEGLNLLGLLSDRIEILKTDYYQAPGIENPFKQIPTAVGTYLELILWPQRLVFYHSEETIITTKELALKVGLFVPYAAATVYAFFKNKKIFFWLAFFFVTLIPVLTPLKISWIVAERYVYFGTVGLLITIAFLINKLRQQVKNDAIVWIVVALITIALGTRTYFRNQNFKDQDALWLASAKYAPNSPQNHNNLGDLYARRGEWDRAIEEFQTAIRLKPNYADAYHNLGNTYRQAGDQEKAIQSYQKATQFNHNLWQSYQNLGALYYEQQQLKPATEALKKATQINPDNDQLHANLGTVYFRTGQAELAKQEFKKALGLNPENERARQGMAAVSEQEKKSSPISD